MVDHDYIDTDAAIRVGSKVSEAAESAKDAHDVVPGAACVWHFEMGDTRFKVVVSVAHPIDHDGMN